MPLFHRGQRVGSGADADRWQVVRKIGEGQFAEVYEVRDMRMDGDARVGPWGCMTCIISMHPAPLCMLKHGQHQSATAKPRHLHALLCIPRPPNSLL